MLYLVTMHSGPGFFSKDQALTLLEDTVLPLFEALIKLEAEKKIVAGGVQSGGRSLFTYFQRIIPRRAGPHFKDLADVGHDGVADCALANAC